MTKSETTSLRLTPAQREAVGACVAKRGGTFAKYWQTEATFARIECAIGAAKAGLVRAIHAAILQRLDDLTARGELTRDEERELPPLAEWIDLLAALGAHDGEHFAARAERLLVLVPESAAAAVRDYFGKTLPRMD